MRLPQLSEEILELLERGELSRSHGVALLKVKDLDERLPLARAAIEEGWTVLTLDARAHASNVDALESLQDRGEQAQGWVQERDLAALNVARAWGDLLGAEVHVRSMRGRQMRMEVEFDFASEGTALAERLAIASSRGAKRR